MVSLTEFMESNDYKNLEKYHVYWGRSFMFLGAVFLLNSWRGGELILITGILMYALVYFSSPFRGCSYNYDWTLVYPELAGLTDDFDDENIAINEEERAVRNLKIVIEKLKDDIEVLKREK